MYIVMTSLTNNYRFSPFSNHNSFPLTFTFQVFNLIYMMYLIIFIIRTTT